MDTATAKYLSESVGPVLAKAMAEMAVTQPTDGVDFLSKWLATYAEQEEAKMLREKDEKLLEEERAKTKAILDTKAARIQEKADEKEKKQKMFQDHVDELNNKETVFTDSMWFTFVEVARITAGAKAAYLALQDEEGLTGVEGPLLRYTAATQGSEWMTEKILPKETGVSWGALTQDPTEEVILEKKLWKPPLPPPVVVEVAEGEEPAEPVPVPLPPYLPVSIPCVTDVPEVHYFDMTRLGAYLAVPLVYPSYYTEGARAEAKEFEKKKKEDQKAREEEAAAKAAAAEAGTEPAEGEAAPAEPVEEKPMELKGTDVKMVLCMDTLGTNTAIEESKIVDLIELCKACSACKAQTELSFVDQQALMEINEELRAEIDEKIAAARAEPLMDEEKMAAATQAAEEKEAELEDELKEPFKALNEKKMAYLKAVKVAVGLQDLILSLLSWVVVPPEFLNVIAAIALMYGASKEELYPKRKAALQWDKLKTVLSPKLFTMIESADVAGERKGLTPEQKLKKVKEMGLPASLDEEAAKAIWPSFELLFSLLKAAVEYREQYLEYKKAEVEKMKTAKEAAGEEYQGPEIPELETLDDDFVE
jgi:hypothetical protein